MKIWTVQKRYIIDDVMRGNAYYPDFKRSYYVKHIPNLDKLFDYLLNSFNNVNDSDATGLIFGFLREVDGWVEEIPTFAAFKRLIRRKRDVVNALWDHYEEQAEKYYVVELDYAEQFNPLFIDFNDYQALMPPQVEIEPYTKQDFARLQGLLRVGKMEESIFPSGLVQTHTPWIRPENISSVHPFFPMS